jgi:hypothetical protein
VLSVQVPPRTLTLATLSAALTSTTCSVWADGLQAVGDRIAEKAAEDRALAEPVPVAVTLTPRSCRQRPGTGCPPSERGRQVVVFFQDSGKFNYLYSTLGFQDAANLDDGDLWPVSYALQQWGPVVEKKVVELVKAGARSVREADRMVGGDGHGRSGRTWWPTPCCRPGRGRR